MPIQPGLIRQAAAIPLRNGQVCLVSSRSGKRWVVPKGCMEPGKTAGEIALQEAWEEAGLVGILQPEPVGSWVYEKDGFTCHVIVFLLAVTDTVENHPEAHFRKRIWLPIPQALSYIDDPGLRELIRGVAVSRADSLWEGANGRASLTRRSPHAGPPEEDVPGQARQEE